MERHIPCSRRPIPNRCPQRLPSTGIDIPPMSDSKTWILPRILHGPTLCRHTCETPVDRVETSPGGLHTRSSSLRPAPPPPTTIRDDLGEGVHSGSSCSHTAQGPSPWIWDALHRSSICTVPIRGRCLIFPCLVLPIANLPKRGTRSTSSLREEPFWTRHRKPSLTSCKPGDCSGSVPSCGIKAGVAQEGII